MYISKELRRICLYLQNVLSNKQVMEVNNLFDNINWDYFLSLSNHHRVYPLLYDFLSKSEMTNIPIIVMDTLRKKYNKNTLNMLSMTSELLRLIQLLHRNNIKVISVKGPLLANKIYGDISLRPNRDLDILVHMDDLLRVQELLLQEDYEIDYSDHEFTDCQMNEYIRKCHHLAYYHRGKRTVIEVHWRLLGESSRYSLFSDFYTLWKKSKKTTMSGINIPVLEDELLFVYLVIHGSKHGWYRLRWLCDIAFFLTKENLDYSKVLYYVEEYGIQEMLGQALIMTNLLFKTPIISSLEKYTKLIKAKVLAKSSLSLLDNTIASSYHHPLNLSYYRFRLYQLFITKGLTAKTKLLLAPFRFDLQYPEDLSLPKGLSFLYYFSGPYFWLKRQTEKRRVGKQKST